MDLQDRLLLRLRGDWINKEAAEGRDRQVRFVGCSKRWIQTFEMEVKIHYYSRSKVQHECVLYYSV